MSRWSKKFYTFFFLVSLAVAGVLSYYASSHPDGLLLDPRRDVAGDGRLPPLGAGIRRPQEHEHALARLATAQERPDRLRPEVRN